MSADHLDLDSDIHALRSATHRKLVALVALVVAALASAAWFLLSRKGEGNAEDPGSVIVVQRGDTIGYSSYLDSNGFEAIAGTLHALELKAQDEVPDLEHSGLAAVLQLADRFGYGYVAVEYPQEVDLTGLDTGEVPEFGPDVRFAVFSAGDLAHPHEVTVNPEPSKIMNDPGILLLQALFEQERLHQALPDAERRGVDDIRLGDRLREALEKLERVPDAEKMAEKIVAGMRTKLVDEEQADPKPMIVGEMLEAMQSLPLANGTILSFRRGFALVSKDGMTAQLDFSDSRDLLATVPGADPAERKPCTSLVGGTIAGTDAPEVALSADRSTVLLRTLSHGLQLWKIAADSQDCAFELLGSLPAPRSGEQELGVVHPSGKVARVAEHDGTYLLNVAHADGSTIEGFGMLAEPLWRPQWLDDTHLVAITSVVGAHGLVFFDTADPMKLHWIDPLAGARITDIAVVAGNERRLIMLANDRAYRLDFTQGFAELAGTTPRETIARADQGAPDIAVLDSNLVAATALTTFDANLSDLAISPDGSFAAVRVRAPSELHSNSSEIAVLDLARPGTMRLLSKNDLPDANPQFTSDGNHLIFDTRVEIPKTRWVIWTTRLAAIAP